MKNITIRDCVFEFDENLINRFESLVCDKLENLVEYYIEMGFDEDTLDKIFAAHSKEEMHNKILESIMAEIRMFE